MKNRTVRRILRYIGIIIEAISVVAGLVIPIVFAVVLPIMKALNYYSAGGKGLGVMVGAALMSVVLAPLLAVIIFAPLFIIGAAIREVFADKEEPITEQSNTKEKMIQISETDLRKILNQKSQQDDFYIVKEDNPNRSDAGIAEMNWRLSHPEQYKKENDNGE